MKTIQTSAYVSLLVEAKKKGKKYPTYNPNPWAVCHESVGPEKSDKFERCVKHVKEKADVVD